MFSCSAKSQNSMFLTVFSLFLSRSMQCLVTNYFASDTACFGIPISDGMSLERFIDQNRSPSSAFKVCIGTFLIRIDAYFSI